MSRSRSVSRKSDSSYVSTTRALVGPSLSYPPCEAERMNFLLVLQARVLRNVLRAITAPLLATITISGCARANAPVFETVLDTTTPNSVISAPSAISGSAASSGSAPTSGSASSAGSAANTDGPAIVAPRRKGRLVPNAEVVHIVDGDTIDVVFAESGKRERIRLIGIDTPESKRPNTPIECFAKKASAAIASLVPDHTLVRIEHDAELRDQYQRYLGYVYRAQDGLFVNFEMARVGMAVPLTFPPNVAFAAEFMQAGEAARSAGVGLWSACESGHTPETASGVVSAT